MTVHPPPHPYPCPYPMPFPMPLWTLPVSPQHSGECLGDCLQGGVGWVCSLPWSCCSQPERLWLREGEDDVLLSP